MVAIKSHEADRFLAKPPAHVFFYLVFGTDAGLVAERARGILSRAIDDPKDPFQLLRISGDDLASDPLRLADEANTIPLFGGRRAIHVEARGKAFIAALEPVLAVPPRDCTIVVEAGALKKDAALRKLGEREKCAAAIECLPDSGKDLAQLIGGEVAAAGLSIAPEVKAHLAALLGQDRLVTRSELEKLILFAHGGGEIGLAHIDAIVSDASTLALDAAVDAAFSGDFAALEAAVRRIFRDSSDVNRLLAVALGHAVGLHRARLDSESREGSRETPGFGLAPWGFFRRTAGFDQQLRAWTPARLAKAIDVLAEAVPAARLEPKLAEPIALRALWKVASAARQGRGTTKPA